VSPASLEERRTVLLGIGVEISIAASVRRAQPSDTAALTELVNRAYSIEASFLEGDRTTADEIATLIQSDEFLVLEYADGLAAAVLFRGAGQSGQPGQPGQHGGTPARHRSSSAYFGMLSVLPELQGRGLGRRLVQVAEAMGEATGATSMTLRIINLREELSRWYKSLGYREVGTAPMTHRSIKRPCHFIEMAKPLVPEGLLHASSAIVTS
jgi:ribosomal protein S18 acetylase RimI-like enzyme